MRTTDIDYHIAERQLKMTNANGFSSSFSTIWCGNFIHVLWNNAANEVVQIWPEDVVAEEDLGTLSFIIDNFMKFS
jgi:hypothetical protein